MDRVSSNSSNLLVGLDSLDGGVFAIGASLALGYNVSTGERGLERCQLRTPAWIMHDDELTWFRLSSMSTVISQSTHAALVSPP